MTARGPSLRDQMFGSANPFSFHDQFFSRGASGRHRAEEGSEANTISKWPGTNPTWWDFLGERSQDLPHPVSVADLPHPELYGVARPIGDANDREVAEYDSKWWANQTFMYYQLHPEWGEWPGAGNNRIMAHIFEIPD